MDENLKEIKAFVKQHKNELVIAMFKISRLVGYKDIPGDDYYWVLSEANSWKKQRTLHSCVGSLIPLKGSIPDEEYNRLDKMFKLNERK